MLDNSVFIIAEAGVNHNGSLDIARQLVDVAIDCGADAVKFQTFKASNLVAKSAPKAEYQLQTTSKYETQLDMIKKLEMDEKFHLELIDRCKKKKVIFMSTPFDLESVSLLNKLNLNVIKIPSGEITNLPYLKKIGALSKKIILSTGMSTLGEVEFALNVLIESGTSKENITVLHCNTEYPTPFEDVNLRAMLTLKEAFKIKIGYSDHTPGIEIPLAAVALGATLIEKHFTLDRNMEGPDHKASLEPDELKKMIRCIRNVEKSLGNGIKKPSNSEIKNIVIARKSIVASKKICKNEVFDENNITVKRPGSGISPTFWDRIIGRKAQKDYHEDEFIEI